MAYNHKQELSKPERFVGGHRLCAGCGAGLVCRGMMRALIPLRAMSSTRPWAIASVSTVISKWKSPRGLETNPLPRNAPRR